MVSSLAGGWSVDLRCFGAVDVALITDLLPKVQSENAKTFGVFNIAQALPQSLVPALFIGGAVVGIVGAVLVTRIKRS
ncbi:hypothetical protein [Arthrobacter sp. Z4-13]